MRKADFSKSNSNSTSALSIQDRGFTLIEVIVVISIIASLITIGTIGFQVVHKANVRSLSADIVTGMREARVRTLGENETSYEFRFVYKNQQYGYALYKKVATAAPVLVEEKLYPAELVIATGIWTGTEVQYTDFKAPTLNIMLHSENAGFVFDPASGGIRDQVFSGAGVNSLRANSTNSIGKYKIYSTKTDMVQYVTIAKINGRVSYED